MLLSKEFGLDRLAGRADRHLHLATAFNGLDFRYLASHPTAEDSML